MAFQLEGMTDLMRYLNDMGRRIDSSAKEKALVAGAEIFRDKAKEIVPVRTGRLRDNIIISDVDHQQNVIHVGPDQQGTAFYGHILEFGRKAGVARIKRNGQYINYPYSYMSPRPFLGPAYENNKQAVQNKMAEVVRRELGL